MCPYRTPNWAIVVFVQSNPCPFKAHQTSGKYWDMAVIKYKYKYKAMTSTELLPFQLMSFP